MPASFSSIRVHVIFSTKERRSFLSPQIRERLWPYISKTAQALGYRVLAAGGTADHIHLLVIVPSKVAVAVAVQKLKANTSRWIREEFKLHLFSWQDGYGAFSVSLSSSAAVINYIRNQRVHHQKADFQAEFQRMLSAHGVEPESLPSYGL